MLRSLLAVSVIITSALATPALRAVQKFAGPVVPNSYLVTLKAGSSKSSFLKAHPELAGTVTHNDWDSSLLNGFAGVFDKTTLDILRGSADVASVAEDGLVFSQTVQTDAPWGLGRLSSASTLTGSASALNYSFAYEAAHQGRGVDIYVVDTGIYTAHNEFGGRATNGWTAPGLGLTDDQGHGTYCAGVAAGTRFGVAKLATLIGVKVLSASGSGTLADVVSGFSYVLTTAKASGRPSVVLFAGGGGASTAVDNAVVALTNAGIHVVVAAGGSNTGVDNTSPARVPSAITVGATTIADARASFSNYGPGIDIFAPGVTITGPTIGSPNATIVLSGTSPSTAYVAGLVALYISQVGNGTPPAISTNLWSTYGVLSGIPTGTVNRLAKGPITL